MPDIFLKPGLTTPTDISLGDPTSAPARWGWASDNSESIAAQVAIGARRAVTALLIAASVGLSLPLAPPVSASTTVGVPIDAGSAPPRISRVYYQARFEPPYLAPVTSLGWHSGLSLAPPVAKAQAGFSSDPLYVAPAVASYTNFGWHQPLSSPLPLPKAQAGFSFVPFDTAQLIVNYNNLGWYQPLSNAAPVAKAQQGYSFVPFNTVQLSANYTDFSWYQPLSTAPSVTKAQPGFISVPFNTSQVVGVAWQSPLSAPLAVNRLADNDYSLPLYTSAIDNTVTIDKWQQPLSVAPAVAKAQQGDAFVPFDTAQIVVVYPTGVPVDAGIAPPRTRRVYYQASSNPLYIAPAIVSYTNLGWHQPLSTAAVGPKVRLSDWQLPYTVVVTNNGWQAALAAPLPLPKAQAGFSEVPYNTPQRFAYTNLGWYQTLSTVPRVTPKGQQGFSSVPFDTPQRFAYTNFGWYQPLAVPSKVAVPQMGMSFVPFNTTQVTPGATDNDRIVKFIGNVGHMMLR